MSLIRINKVEISHIDIINTAKGRTGRQIKTQYKPNVVINGALYDMSSKENIVFLEDENVADGYLFSDKGFGITKTGEILWTTYTEATKNEDIKDYISGAPVLIQEGKVKIDWGNKKSTQIQGQHLRSAIGFNQNEVIFYCSDDSITLETLANRMLSYTCEYAINLDGGGSQYLQEEDTILKSSSRSNKTWIVLYKKVVENTMSQYKITAKSALNIRSTPSTSGTIVGTYKSGEIVSVSTIQNNWGKTSKGWISMSYATPVNNIPSAATNVINDIGYLHPKVQELCFKLLDKCAEEGLNVGVFETYRTDERQQYLYTQGNTTVKTRGAHGFCVAFDIVCKDSKGNWTWDTSDKIVKNTFYRVGELGQSLGLEWGGAWKTFVDLPHFQYLGGITLANYQNNKRPTWWNDWQIGDLKPIEWKNNTPAEDEQNLKVTDEPSDWAEEACNKAISLKLIEGNGNNYYGWHDNITLERLIVILNKLKLLK